MQTVDNEADFALPSGDLTYGIGEPATGIDSYATVSDLDTADYNGGGLTVTITAGGSSNDRLDVRNTGTDAGQIGVSGSTISYGGVTIGTKSGGTGTTPLSITFNSTAATPEAAQALVRSVTYQNVDANAAPQSRTLSFALADGDGGVSTVTKNDHHPAYAHLQLPAGCGRWLWASTPVLWTPRFTLIFRILPTRQVTMRADCGLIIILWPCSLRIRCNVSSSSRTCLAPVPARFPPGAKIVFAELTMNVTDSGHGALFNRMLGDWDEYVTFNSLGGGIQLDGIEAVSGTNSFMGDQAHNTTIRDRPQADWRYR